MIQIPEPPTVAACSTCMQPLLWLYSARTSRWVALKNRTDKETT